jgi:tricorn protease
MSIHYWSVLMNRRAHKLKSARGLIVAPASVLTLALALCTGTATTVAAGVDGYYRMPSIIPGKAGAWSGGVVDAGIIFVAEGDLWTVPATGGTATRLTTHPGEETSPIVTADGSLVAFIAQYEGPAEVYTMPLAGGLPTRRTFDGAVGRGLGVSGWTDDGKLVYSTNAYSTIPDAQLFTLDLSSGSRRAVELHQAADGSFDANGTLFFTRLPFQGSHTKRYKGGTAQQIWKWDGKGEAVALTKDYDGTSKRPMIYKDRVYFATDRDGTMNLWSMDAAGKDLQQHTRHSGWDIIAPSMTGSVATYQVGADIWIFDAQRGSETKVNISLGTDLDHTREKWIRRPNEWITSVDISPSGDRAVLTARGQVFVAPARQGRLVEISQLNGSRSRAATFLNDDTVVVLTDKQADRTPSEVELWSAPANGVGQAAQLTTDAGVLRWGMVVSPDGKWIAHYDKNQKLYVYDVESKSNRKIDESKVDDFQSLVWSPDSRWLAYVEVGENSYRRIKLQRIEDGQTLYSTSERYDSYSPAWSADGKWLYFLSDRALSSTVSSPWGTLQPEPFFENRSKLMAVSLKKGERFPFQPMDEIEQARKEREKKEKDKKPDDKKEPAPAVPPAQPAEPEPNKEPVGIKAQPADPVPAKTPEPKKDGAKKDDTKSEDAKKAKDKVKVDIDADGLIQRLYEVPIASGNYNSLSAAEKGLFWIASYRGEGKPELKGLAITNENIEVKTVLADCRSYELSRDGKKMLVRRGETIAIIDVAVAPADLAKKEINLAGWNIALDPRSEWRQMFTESWRLMRDYFYAPDMHGINWNALRTKYEPLVDRVTTRQELADIMAQMVGEISALHHFVRPGDIRRGEDNIAIATLGAVLEPAADGHKVTRIYQHDPDEPSQASPLSMPGVDIQVGDSITMIDGIPTTTVADFKALLRGKAGVQVLLHVKSASGTERDVIVTPISTDRDSDLRYDDWEYTRRKLVEEWSNGQIGYVHLRAMGSENIAEWAKNYFPVFHKMGLIIDVRHNRGGNIDSWILNRLIRKPWFYWSQRVGRSNNWNMQYAFRGHMVTLCDEFTASDGEAFSEGFRRLGLGKVIGTRTWGGEIWLSSSNTLVDRGIATAAETGVFAPDGTWLIEGWGVEPDVVVDNLPHATFKGEDAQLKAAVDELLKQIKDKPVDLPPIPKYPDKSHPTNK